MENQSDKKCCKNKMLVCIIGGILIFAVGFMMGKCCGAKLCPISSSQAQVQMK